MLFQAQPNTCQRFAIRVQQIANWSNSWKELFDNMAKTFLSQTDGHPKDSSFREIYAAQGGIINGEAATFLPNDGMRPKYTGVSPNFPGNGQPGQIRHFVTALIAASYPFGTELMMSREVNPGTRLPTLDMDPDAVADRALNGLGSYIFQTVFKDVRVLGDQVMYFERDMTYIRAHLADEIRRDLCND